MNSHDPDIIPAWKPVPPLSILWREWDGEFVAYHRASGRTHFVNSASHYLLTDLLSNPCSLETIRRAFYGSDDSSVAAQSDGDLEAMLFHFESLGLIERA